MTVNTCAKNGSQMAEDDFTELHKFLFQTPEKASGPNGERFVPKVSKNVQDINPMFGVMSMSMALYTEEEAYNMAFLGLIKMARRLAEIVTKNITIEMIEFTLDEKDR